MNDFRFALRMLLKYPGFTAVAVLTMALGISANTTIFSIISAFFFQPLPVKEPDRLVMVLQKSAAWKLPHGHSWPDYLDYRERVSEFSGLIAFFMTPVHLSAPGHQPERTWIEAVSGNYFSMLGLEAGCGRLFLSGEGEKTGSDSIVVLSHDYWQTKFGGDPTVVGKTINLNGHPFTIIGVTPATFNSAAWAMAVKAFVPASMMDRIMGGGGGLLTSRGAPAFKVMGRLKAGVSLAQARASVEVVARQLAKDFPADHKESRVMVFPEKRCRPEPTFSEFMPLIASVFMTMVGLVLLIACANVANLMFSRALVRQKEMGIRTAMGATRRRLIRQLLVESVLLGVLAGGVGLAFAIWSGDLLSGFNPAGDIPVRTDQSWDWRVFAFTFLMAVIAGVVTGLAPALRATKLDTLTTLKEGGSAMLASGRHPFRSGLVVSQVAICLIVLVCGGLFVRSLQRVAGLNLGFRTERLVMASLDLGLQGYDEARGKQFCRQLLEKVKALPGVQAATLGCFVPFGYNIRLSDVGAEGQISDGPQGKEGFIVAAFNQVSSDYLKAMGIALMRGRDLVEQDNESATKVAVINAHMAQRLWPGQNPLGKRFRFGREGDFIEVAGVARDGRYVMLGEEPRPFFYLPFQQHYSSPVTLHVRTVNNPAGVLPAIRQALRQLDPHLPIYDVRTMEDHLRASAFALMPLRMGATLAGVQGLLGLLLAVMGIYGVVSYVVSQRTREIGIRMALGAQTFDIIRAVVREGLHLTLYGIGIGLTAAMALVHFLRTLLYGVNPTDALVFTGVTILLASAALLACYVPARRATKVDPMVALRYE